MGAREVETSGMRLMEALRLWAKDVEFSHDEILIRDAGLIKPATPSLAAYLL